MMGKRKGSKPIVSWETLSSFQGIYLPGSDSDKTLRDAQRVRENKDAESVIKNPPKMPLLPMYDSDNIGDILSRPAHYNASEEFCGMLDSEGLRVIDHRLRFCRYVLHQLNLPSDCEGKILVNDNGGWGYEVALLKKIGQKPSSHNGGTDCKTDVSYQGLTPYEPLDWIHTHVEFFTAGWYAARLLAYYHRANALDEKAYTDFSSVSYGLAREWMLFGELWAEAKYIMNFGEIIISSMSRAENAGISGAAASKSQLASRLNLFLKEIEKLGNHYPAMGEDAIVDQAFKNAVEKNPSLWRQGQSQKENYLSKYLRSEEPYKSRYWAIFDRTA